MIVTFDDATGLGFDLVLLCPFFTAFGLTGFILSFKVSDGELGLTVLFAAFASASKRPLRNSGSPKSSDSSLRSPAAPSLRAWLVFSIAFLSPMSDLV